MIFLLVFATALELDPLKERIENGKLHYEVYKNSGGCWEKAIEAMISTCGEMDENTQSLFAAKLTNCHLKRLGLKEITCEIGKGCELDSNSYIAYTQFFTHSFDICVYVSFKSWQQKTQNTIKSLAQVSEISLKSIQDSQQILNSISLKQEDLHNSVIKSIELHKELQAELINSRDEIQDFALDFMNSSKQFQAEMNKQQEFIGKWFNKLYKSISEISYMQEAILLEIWDLNSIFFYVFFVGVFTFITSFPETYACRSKIFCLFAVEVFIERLNPINSKPMRTFLIFSCSLLLFHNIRSYKQYDRLSYDMLKDVLLRIGNKALIALTPKNLDIKPKMSPLKRQCLRSLNLIPEIPEVLEQDFIPMKKPKRSSEVSIMYKAFSEKKPKRPRGVFDEIY